MANNLPQNIIDVQAKLPKRRFKMPDDLPIYAIDLWKKHEPYAWKSGILTAETLPDFIEMCRIYDEYIKINIIMNEQGLTIKSRTGTNKINPLWKKENKLSKKLSRFFNKFGMSPLSRAKKNLPSPADLGLE